MSSLLDAMPSTIDITLSNAPGPGTVVELLKPITWFPPMWAFGCGVVSAGAPLADRWPEILAGFILTGPMVCGTSQVVNDWYDRHVDAINEPNRPIPSGRVPGAWGFYIAVVWTALSMCLAAALGAWVLAAAALGIAFAWAYSAPPLRLKTNGWIGNAAVGACYEGLPWLTGFAVMAATLPTWQAFAMAGLYSFGAHGIMTLNDFKSIEGDLRSGIRSLPVQLGARSAALCACIFMTAPQAAVAALLWDWGAPYHAAAVGASTLAQVALMRRLLSDPRALAPWYNATGVSLYVLGMLVTAFALRSLP